MRKRPERRVSLVSDRRRSRRGGRRLTDHDGSFPPRVVVCVECQTGTADLLGVATERGKTTATYRCRDCGHQFDSTAE
jgi:DNA-directed RNA polymerase subunit RPC12/RpoP